MPKAAPKKLDKVRACEAALAKVSSIAMSPYSNKFSTKVPTGKGAPNSISKQR